MLPKEEGSVGEEAMGFEPDAPVRTREFRIGAIGAGMIMAECHLAAYAQAGFPVAAIASRTAANARKVAERWNIPKVHDTPERLIEDRQVEIVDLAFPPDRQPALIRHALRQPHVKAILAQKPLALSLEEAIRLRDEAAAAGKVLSVNQNMRFDQAMRVLKQIRRLAQMTRDAAAHLAGNLAGEESFAELELLAVQLTSAVRGIPPEAATVRARVSSISPGVPGRFP